MILAMVFLLFCTFVGSSVLVSATANAYRVNHLSDQQDFLTERSAALLLTDELQLEDEVRGNPAEYLQLVVIDIDKCRQPVDVEESGAVIPQGNPSPHREITFQVITNIDTDDLTAMQRLQLESAVLRYLDENPAKSSALIPSTEGNPSPTAGITVKLKGFPGITDSAAYVSMAEAVSNFWLKTSADGAIEGTVTFTETKNSANDIVIPSFDVNFSCGKGDELYDFWMDFGEASLLKVNMNAYYGSKPQVEVNYPASVNPDYDEDAAGSKKYEQISTISTRTVISWGDPLIEKGAAADET